MYDEDDANYYFHTGPNLGAEILAAELQDLSRCLIVLHALSERPEGSVTCTDDVSGAPLDEGLVRHGRALEMQFLGAMGVCIRVPREKAHLSGHGEIIRGRWPDINMGDGERSDYRSGFVGKEYNTGAGPALYGATHILEALKLILGHAASHRQEGLHVNLCDVKRAFVHAKASRTSMLSFRMRTRVGQPARWAV